METMQYGWLNKMVKDNERKKNEDESKKRERQVMKTNDKTVTSAHNLREILNRCLKRNNYRTKQPG